MKNKKTIVHAPTTEKDILSILRAVLKEKPRTRADFLLAKKRIAGRFGIMPPPNRLLLTAYHTLTKKSSPAAGRKKARTEEHIPHWLTTRAVRSISGVSIITVLTKPFPCPGTCVYCPTEARMPKSYVASEPAAARSLRHHFDPYEITLRRIELLERNGHPTDKIELILKGGTWSAYPEWYQAWFVGRCFDAANQAGTRLPACLSVREPRRITRASIARLWRALARAQTYNDRRSRHKIIGLTIETRPDSIHVPELLRLRALGVTRVELGVQHTNDRINRLTKRGHTLAETKRAAMLLRTAGFKVDFHTMPQLPGATPADDRAMYKKLYTDEGLRPDMIKIYPCVVMPSAELAGWLRDGRYRPYPLAQLKKVLTYAKKITPPYVRISRLIRDIPSTEIIGGNTVTNLRELIQKEMAERGEVCRCLRCREFGRQIVHHPELLHTAPILLTDTYQSSGGTEFFIRFEDPARRAVYGFCRLRINGPTSPRTHAIYTAFPELSGAAIIRELHTYGALVPLGTKNKTSAQHKGLGRLLIREAERIARAHGVRRMAVIAGIGVRAYYRTCGYRTNHTYMTKTL